MSFQAENRVVRLKEFNIAFKYLVAGGVGGNMVVSYYHSGDTPLSVLLVFFMAFCMWSAYKTGDQAKQIQNNIDTIESADSGKDQKRRAEQSLEYQVAEPLWKTICS